MRINEQMMREMRELSEDYIIALKHTRQSVAGWCYRGAVQGIYRELCLQLHAIPGASSLAEASDPYEAGAQLYAQFCAQVRDEAQAMVESVVEGTQGGA